MKTTKKILAVLLTLLLTAGLLAGCGGTEPTPPPKTDQKLVAEKVGSFDAYVFPYYQDGDTGYVYEDEDSNYVLLDYDGTEVFKTDEYMEKEKGYYKVSINDLAKDETDYAIINSMGLIDEKGEEVIPRQYGDIQVINPRYALAIEATGISDDWSNSLFSWPADWFDKEMDGDVRFTGTWTLFDLEKRAFVEGVSGTKSPAGANRGTIFSYMDDEDVFHQLRPDGTELPAGATVFDNDAYRWTDEDDKTAVYDIDGKKLFDCDPAGYRPIMSCNEYFVGQKFLDDSQYRYVLMDGKGKVLTPEFEDGNFTIFGDLLIADHYLRDLSGNIVLDAEIKTDFPDKTRGRALMFKTTDGQVIVYDALKKEVVYQEPESDAYYYDGAACAVRKSGKAPFGLYSWVDRDFTFAGFVHAGMLATAKNEDDTARLVDLTNNDVLLDGYPAYSVYGTLDTCLRVAASNDETTDVYFLTEA